MPSLAVAAEEEHLVLCLMRGVLIQLVDLVVEALPQREFGIFAICVCVVGAVDEAEVVCCLFALSIQALFRVNAGRTYVVKSRRISASLVLQKVPRHSGILVGSSLRRRGEAESECGETQCALHFAIDPDADAAGKPLGLRRRVPILYYSI
jgi:hypothetical protein